MRFVLKIAIQTFPFRAIFQRLQALETARFARAGIIGMEACSNGFSNRFRFFEVITPFR